MNSVKSFVNKNKTDSKNLTLFYYSFFLLIIFLIMLFIYKLLLIYSLFFFSIVINIIYYNIKMNTYTIKLMNEINLIIQ